MADVTGSSAITHQDSVEKASNEHLEIAGGRAIVRTDSYKVSVSLCPPSVDMFLLLNLVQDDEHIQLTWRSWVVV